MAKAPTQVHSTIGPRDVRPIIITAEEVRRVGIAGLGMDSIGVGITPGSISKVVSAMDEAVTVPTASTLLQFAQAWLPGTIRVLTTARKADKLIGVRTVGSWEMESVIQKIMESLGVAQPYTDSGNISLSSYNPSYEQRDIVRFEAGLQVGILEQARASLMKINPSTEKRDAALLELEINRNLVALYGYNAGSGNRTYGMLNDPGLLPYITVAPGASGDTEWSTKTWMEITRDLRASFARLRTRSGDTIEPRDADITIALNSSNGEFLSITNEFGVSVEDWLQKNYKRVRIETVPEFDGANGGENVAYIYVEKVEGTGDDDGSTWQQLVASKAQPLNIEKRVKVVVEGYTNALAGSMCTRPFATDRITGI